MSDPRPNVKQTAMARIAARFAALGVAAPDQRRAIAYLTGVRQWNRLTNVQARVIEDHLQSMQTRDQVLRWLGDAAAPRKDNTP